MKAKSIFVSIVILLLLNHAGATAPSDWTTGVQVDDLITMNNVHQGTPFSYEIMSGGSLVQTIIEKGDKIEHLITNITTDTIWYVRKTIDSTGGLKVASDPIPIPRNNTDIRVNFFYPNTYNDSNGGFFTPVITTNVEELSSAYTGHVEYELILTTEKIIFEYLTTAESIFANHRVEYDRDTGIIRYIEWRFNTGVLHVQLIREDLLDEYVHSKCVACNTDVTTTTDPSTTEESPLSMPLYGLFLLVLSVVSQSRRKQ